MKQLQRRLLLPATHDTPRRFDNVWHLSTMRRGKELTFIRHDLGKHLLGARRCKTMLLIDDQLATQGH
eukprot:1574667-Amphidinium_carterae.1